MQFTLSENNLNALVNEVIKRFETCKILLLKGDLGSGKTTFVKKLLLSLGVSDKVTSPTFNIVSEYHLSNGTSIYHFDLYRIQSIDELYNLGFEDYMYLNNICVIEWPEIAEALLPDNVITIYIENKESERLYSLN